LKKSTGGFLLPLCFRLFGLHFGCFRPTRSHVIINFLYIGVPFVGFDNYRYRKSANRGDAGNRQPWRMAGYGGEFNRSMQHCP
jgi:hypothetical protein